MEELLEGNDSRVHAHSLLEWVEPLEEETAEGMQSREHDHDHEEEALKNGAAEETAGGTEAFAEDAGVHLEEGEYDEHVWTSPANAILIVEKIRDTLISIDPDRAGIYEENARVYLEQLRSLDSDYRRVIGEAKRHTVIFGDRFPFLYLVKTYGLDYYAAFPGCSSETEPSAATIAFLTDEVKEEHIPVVFYLELSNAKVADAIAEVTGARTAMLHSCHTLTREEMQRGENYLSLMRQNLEQLKLTLAEKLRKLLSAKPQTSSISAMTQQICDYVNEHLSDPNLTLKRIAEQHLFMNTDYVSKKFQKETGTRFSSYLTDVRIERAKQLLVSAESDKIQTIAEQVGCGNSPQYFSQLFKKKTGMTPSSYIARIHGEG